MKKLSLIIFITGFVVVIVLLMQLPIITGRGVNRVQEGLAATKTIELSGKTLFLSDLHITAQPSLNKQFNLDFSNAQNVIIVGNFFHSSKDFWSFGTTEEEVFENVFFGIIPEDFSGQIFFIHSLTHDPQGLQTTQFSFGKVQFFHIGRYGKFLVNGIPVIAYHGEQLHGGLVGGGISWLAEKLGQPLFLERLGKKRFEIPDNTWVINGHSHVPGISQQEKVANTGSFVGAPFNKFIFKIHIGTGILFSGDQVQLQEYEGLNIKKLYPFTI